MTLKTNATMTFNSYKVEEGGIRLVFLCPDPGAGEESYWNVLITDAELGTITTAQQFKDMVKTKLQRLFRATGIATKLDALIGQSITGV